MAENKVYLGDSVYAAFDGYHVVLTTENGLGPSNTIYLKSNVLTALWQYVEELVGDRPVAAQQEDAADG